MADVTVNNDVVANIEINFEYGPIWTSDTVGYAFYSDAGNQNILYTKTTDGGATWGAGVSIDTDAGGGLYKFHVWYDQFTPGDSGTKIHIVWNFWGTDAIMYNTLETATDTIGTERTVASGLSYTPNTVTWAQFTCSITKARGGNLYIRGVSGGNLVFYRSTDAGVNWTSRTTPGEGVVDVAYLLPANVADTQDICCIFDDVSANAISIKMYDDSANTWTETAIASMTENVLANNFAASVRHSDGHVLLAFWNAYDTTTADLQTYDLTVDSIASPTVTAKTNVLTDSAESIQCCLFINQANDDVYAGYLKGGTVGTTMGVFYKLSTDDMGTWGGETTYDEGADGDYVQLSSGLGVKSGQSGRFYIIWSDDADNDLMGNKVNSIAITVAAGTKAPPPRRRPVRFVRRVA